MNEIRILALLIRDRVKEAGSVQSIIGRYASVVRSRLGFHELTEASCSRVGIIILQLSGDISLQQQLEEELQQVRGIEIKRISFEI
ncbi:MAG: hypothetical protein FWG84_00310 [Bacteroidales bacterium]|nr:hypothetical protein [Bacteroidales bacterium]